MLCSGLRVSQVHGVPKHLPPLQSEIHQLLFGFRKSLGFSHERHTRLSLWLPHHITFTWPLTAPSTIDRCTNPMM